MLTPPFPLHPCTSFRDEIKKTFQNIFTLRVAGPSLQPSVTVGSVFIHRISELIEHVN